MPTTPPSDLLDREWSRAKVADAIEVAVPLLQEVVNYGVAAFTRCFPALQDGDYHFAVLMPFKHVLEMTDAVQILIEAGTSGPAQLPLRSAFESLLTIEYIVEADTERRAYAWLAAQAQREIVKLWTVRSRHPDLDARPERTDEHLVTLQRRLERPGWKEANDRLLSAAARRMRRRGRFHPVEWFMLGDGPMSRAELATRLKRAKEYDVLYRQWSGVVHGNDLEDNLVKGPGQQVVVRRLRLPANFGIVVSLAVTMTYDAISRVLLFYRPGEELSLRAWYVRELQGPLRRF